MTQLNPTNRTPAVPSAPPAAALPSTAPAAPKVEIPKAAEIIAGELKAHAPKEEHFDWEKSLPKGAGHALHHAAEQAAQAFGFGHAGEQAGQAHASHHAGEQAGHALAKALHHAAEQAGEAFGFGNAGEHAGHGHVGQHVHHREEAADLPVNASGPATQAGGLRARD